MCPCVFTFKEVSDWTAEYSDLWDHHTEEIKKLHPTQQDNDYENIYHCSVPSYCSWVQFKSWKDKSLDSLGPWSHFSSPNAKICVSYKHVNIHVCMPWEYIALNVCELLSRKSPLLQHACTLSHCPCLPSLLTLTAVLFFCASFTAITMTPPNLPSRVNVITQSSVVLPDH